MLVTHQGTARWTHDEVVSSLKLTGIQISPWFVRLFVAPFLGLSLLMVLVAVLEKPSSATALPALFVAVAVLAWPIVIRLARRRRASQLLKSSRTDFGIALRHDGILVATPSTSQLLPWNNVASWRQHRSTIHVETDTVPLQIPTSALDDTLTVELQSRLTSAANLGPVRISTGFQPTGPTDDLIDARLVEYNSDFALLERFDELARRTSVAPSAHVRWGTLIFFYISFSAFITTVIMLFVPISWWALFPISVCFGLFKHYQTKRYIQKRFSDTAPADPRVQLRFDDVGFSQRASTDAETAINWEQCSRWIDGGDLLAVEADKQWFPLPVGEFPPSAAAEIRAALERSPAERIVPHR